MIPDPVSERGRLYRTLRAHFHQNGFLEVETPILAESPGMEAHIEPLTAVVSRGTLRKKLYLITSPEFQMKSLLPDHGKIFQITRCFRDNEFSPLHNPEFTMLEWYRANADARALINDTRELIAAVFAAFEKPAPELEIVSYDDMFLRFLPVRPSGCHDLAGLRRELPGSLRGLIVDARTLEQAITMLYVIAVEPRLVEGKWNGILYPFPALFPTLAKASARNPATVERLELYLNGIEIANGFTEVDSAAEFDEKVRAINQTRNHYGLPRFPVDQRYVDLLQSGAMPPAAGIALGCDRLLMILLDKSDLREVLPFHLHDSW